MIGIIEMTAGAATLFIIESRFYTGGDLHHRVHERERERDREMGMDIDTDTDMEY